MSRETDRRKPKLAPEVVPEDALLLFPTTLGVVAVRGEEMAGETLVAEVETGLTVVAGVVGVTAEVLAPADVDAGIELVIPY